ncbi:MAG: 30S ribosomal protein S20 [Armatimonadota bacterium]|nr:30S ribosomal protein S20 [Armatimonadota bacterium]MDR7534016.1 30S ribosomal protein S20 [Armatimonadota bacterium]MDR7536547.1 30S ribosomal protein S20 [Armatimonadota bacterium]
MAKRIRSGLKHLRKSARRRAANASVKSRIKTLVKRALADPSRIPLAQKALDKAALRRVIHPNVAARTKARLMRRASARPA